MASSVPTSRRLASIATAVLVLSMATFARAEQDGAAARAHFRQGEAYYEVGAYEQAIVEYLVAYRLSPHPALLFDLGKAYQQRGDVEHALEYYRRYLGADKRGVAQAEAQAAIVELEATARARAAPSAETHIAAIEHAPPAVVKTSTAEPASSVGWRGARWLGPTLLGIGAGLGAAGGGLVGWSRHEYAALADGCAPECDPQRASAPRSGEIAGAVLLGVGSAAVVVGSVVWAVRARAHPAR